MKNVLVVPEKLMNPAYLPLTRAEERLQFLWGGAGSGKSAFAATRVALDALVGRNTLVVRKVASRIPQSCRNEIRKAVGRMGAERLFKFSRDAVTCTLSGAQILFSGLDDAEKIKSVTPLCGALTDVWVEEATEISWNDFRQLDKRLRGESPFKKRMTLTFNPCDRTHWLYAKYFEGKNISRPIHREEELVMLHTTYRDNRFLTADDARALESERDRFHRAVYTLGEWGKTEESILTRWRTESLLPIAFPKDSVRCGLDFGFAADPAAAVLLSVDNSAKIIYVLDELYLFGAGNDVLAAYLRPFLRGHRVFCDSAEPKSVAELRRLGIPAFSARKGPDSLRHGIRWLKNYDIVVNTSCPRFQRELEGWRWRMTAAGECAGVPRPGNDHLIDAMRYALQNDIAPRAAVLYGG